MIRERLGKELLYFDGGMGTLLQAKGLQPGELPETWNVTHADEIKNIHKQYISAGSDIVLANTFGANALKFHCDDFPLEEIIRLAIGHVKDAAEEAGGGRRIYTALDIGPTGKLLKPMGDLDFETAYETFKEVMILGEKAGADLKNPHIQFATEMVIYGGEEMTMRWIQEGMKVPIEVMLVLFQESIPLIISQYFY
jgi:5-methyltetrahydrofolate--homocysteine methyltransferase